MGKLGSCPRQRALRGPRIFSTRNFWEVTAQTTACRRADLSFFALHLILGGKLDLCGRNDLQTTMSFFCAVQIW